MGNYTFKDANGDKISFTDITSSGLKKASKVIDKEKNKDKKGWNQLHDTAVSEARAGCASDLIESIDSIISSLKSESTACKSASSAWGDDDVHGPAMIASLSARSKSLESQMGFYQHLKLYLAISKPDMMYFKDDDDDNGGTITSSNYKSI